MFYILQVAIDADASSGEQLFLFTCFAQSDVIIDEVAR